MKHLTLECQTAEGLMIRTDTAYLTKCELKSDSDGMKLIVHGSASNLDIHMSCPSPRASSKGRVEYHTVGQRGFGPIEAQSSCGLVRLSAPLKISPTTNGVLSFEKDVDNAKGWLAQCDELAISILNMLSLADGHLIRWSIRKVFEGDTFRRLTICGEKRAAQPHEPLFSHLNLQPILELAISTQEVRKSTGMDVALQWFLMSASHDEARYLFCMTALEHLIEVFSEGLPGRIIPKHLFRNKIRPALARTVDDFSSDLTNDATTVLKAKLGNLNQLTLRTNLRRMNEHYGVPLVDIDDAIGALVRVRNDIVHRGLYEGGAKLSSHLFVLEELLKRTFLSIIEFEGKYITYFPERTDRLFTANPRQMAEEHQPATSKIRRAWQLIKTFRGRANF